MHDSTATHMASDSNSQRIKEAERRRIARNLHDDLGNHLSAVKMALAQLRWQLSAPQTGSTALQEQTDYATELIDGAIVAMHNIMDDLHPAVLDLGLPAALEWLAKIFARQTGVPHCWSMEQIFPTETLDSFQTVSLYRIAHEALHNVGQHATAGKVTIALRLNGPHLLLEIVDDGIGLPTDAAQRPQSSGIRGMHERAVAIGATLTLTSPKSGGVKLQVAVQHCSGNA